MVSRPGPFAFAAVILLAAASPARSADECRPPTPQEKQAIEKLAAAVHKTLIAPLEAQNWKAASSKTAFDSLVVATNPAPPRPLMVCASVFEAKLEIDRQSA